MKIKSEISKDELERLIPQLKKVCRKKGKKEIIHSWLWLLFTVPYCIWFFQFLLRNIHDSPLWTFQSWLFIFLFIINLVVFFVAIALVYGMLFYPIYLKKMPKEDTVFEMDLTEDYKKTIRHVVLLEDYIFIQSLHKMQTRYFILRNDDHLIFDELRRELVPRGKSKLKYKCFEDK